MIGLAGPLVCAALLLGTSALAPNEAAPASMAKVASVAIAPSLAGDTLIREALNRLRAELPLAGMRAVDTEEAPADGTANASVTMSRVEGPNEGEDPRPVVVTVRVVTTPGDGSQARTLLRRTVIHAAEGAGDASVLAIRAVELLRATLMPAVTGASPPGRDGAAARETMVSAPVPASVDASRWAVALGPVALQSLAGFGSAVGATGRASFRPAAPVAFELQAAGPIFAPALTAPAGSASLRQELAFVAVTWLLRDGHRLSPHLSAGAGLYHVRVVGHAEGGLAVSSALWAPLAKVGAGLTLALGRRYALRMDVDALFLQPAPYVVIGTAEAGHAGRPLLLVGLTLERDSPATGVP